MPVTVTASAARTAGRTAQPVRSPVSGGRRSPRRIALGALLVVAFGLLFAVVAVRVDPRTAVLALARAVPAGHVLVDADLREVRIVPDASVPMVPAGARGTVVGRAVAVPIAANSFLTMSQLGLAAWPPAGSAVIAVAIKGGHLPAGVAAGSQVLAVVLPATSSPTGGQPSSTPAVSAPATVVAVANIDTTGTTVVSLLVDSDDGLRITTANADVALILSGAGG